MKTVWIVIAVLVACGLAAVTWVQSSTFASSSEHPLGERAVIDAWFAKAGFRPVPVDPERLPEEREDGCRELRFEHAYTETLARGSEASLVERSDGVLQGVTARFFSGKDGVWHPGVNGPKAEILAFTLWKDLAGELPEFQSTFEGSGRLARQVLVASFEKNGARGRWVKAYDVNGDARTIVDTVTFTRD